MNNSQTLAEEIRYGIKDRGKVETLIKEGADLSFQPSPGETLTTALIFSQYDDDARFMIKLGVKPSLYDAAMLGDLDIVQEYIEASPLMVNQKARDGQTALLGALWRNRNEIVDYLLSKDADVNAYDNANHSALHTVAANNTQRTKQLLELGAQPNVARFLDGDTPLHRSVQTLGSDVERVKLLLEYGADVNASTGQGRTALHFAVLRNQVDITKLLLKNAARIDIEDRYGKTPLDYALEHKDENQEICDELFRVKKEQSSLNASQVKQNQDSSTCFIATAACGSANAEDVIYLREFRDTVLNSTHIGRSIIKAYEHTSPPIADIIKQSSLARKVVRTVIISPSRKIAEHILNK